MDNNKIQPMITYHKFSGCNPNLLRRIERKPNGSGNNDTSNLEVCVFKPTFLELRIFWTEPYYYVQTLKEHTQAKQRYPHKNQATILDWTNWPPAIYGGIKIFNQPVILGGQNTNKIESCCHEKPFAHKNYQRHLDNIN